MAKSFLIAQQARTKSPRPAAYSEIQETSTTTGDPTAKNTQHNARNGDDDEDEKDRFLLIEVDELTHPGDHTGKKLSDQRKQRRKNRSALRSFPLSQKYMQSSPRTEEHHNKAKDSSEDDEITDLRHGEDTEGVLQRKYLHQLNLPNIADLIQVTVVTKTRTTRRAETHACGLRTCTVSVTSSS